MKHVHDCLVDTKTCSTTSVFTAASTIFTVKDVCKIYTRFTRAAKRYTSWNYADPPAPDVSTDTHPSKSQLCIHIGYAKVSIFKKDPLLYLGQQEKQNKTWRQHNLQSQNCYTSSRSLTFYKFHRSTVNNTHIKRLKNNCWKTQMHPGLESKSVTEEKHWMHTHYYTAFT